MAAGLALKADKVFYALGPIGKYQILHLLMVSLGVFPALIQLLDNVFIGAAVEQRCAPPSQNRSSAHDGGLTSVLMSSSLPSSNISVTYGECSIMVNATTRGRVEEHSCVYGFEYDGPRSQSVISQLDLVCDKEQLLRLTQTLVFAGQGLGAIIGPFFSDRFGRKPTMVGANIGMLVLGMTIAVAPNYIVFAITKFLIGALQQSLYIPICIYTGEMLPTDYRRYSIIVNTVAWSAAGLSMSVVAFLMREMSWRYLQAALTLSSLFFLVQLCAMDESIIWLLANGRKKEALKCIKRAARWNNKDFEEVLKAGYSDDIMDMDATEEDRLNSENNVTRPVLEEEKSANGCGQHNQEEDDSITRSEADTSADTGKISFIQVLRVRRLFINAVAMWATWFSASLCYFTLYLMVSTLAGDKYLNYVLTSIMDIPACFIFFFGFNKIGRRSVTILLYSILAAGTFTLGLIRHFTDTESGVWSVITLIMSLVSIVGGSGCFFSIFFYLPELFPTNVRNQATGFASCFARVGAMISPFMAALAGVAIWAPGLVMGVFASVAVFLLLLLPETKDKQLPQTIAEMESWYKKDSSRCDKDLIDNRKAII
ncbi:hypothetical protein EGW08_021068 [Elysia chlorotica]|uniref:Major facilitator superfamily (MFS) profile domain-containing protein n=1 Tax=Elysia chlorotica TaxID=188477 RepID=A0A3S1ASU8_ELYCH|nr:hypothetical protein EGW08_021068 [Elysia chlorotica]